MMRNTPPPLASNDLFDDAPPNYERALDRRTTDRASGGLLDMLAYGINAGWRTAVK